MTDAQSLPSPKRLLQDLVRAATDRSRLQAFLAQWMERLYALKMPAGLRWHLDVDPLEF